MFGKHSLKKEPKVRLIVMGVMLLALLSLSSVSFAGWSSALIYRCDSIGNCYLDNVYVWINPPTPPWF